MREIIFVDPVQLLQKKDTFKLQLGLIGGRKVDGEQNRMG